MTNIFKAFVTFLILSYCSISFSQNIIMTNGTVNACSGTFLDPGGAGPGANGNYGNNQNLVFTICPVAGGGLIQLNFTAFDVEATFDFLTVYDGNSFAAPTLGTYDNNVPLLGTVGATASNASGCLTFEFQSDAIIDLAGWSAIISCIQPCQSVQANLLSSSPVANSNGEINICQGDMVSFIGSGSYPQNGNNYTQSDATSTFLWDFGDGTTATGTNVSHSYPTAGAYFVSLTITDINGCVSTNMISQLIQVSTTPIFAGTFASPDTICIGETSILTGAITPVPYIHSCASPTPQPIALPDGTGVSYQTCLTMDCYLPGQMLTNINDFYSICFDMEHSYMGDLQIEITCPTGQTVELVSYPNNGNATYLGIPVDNDLTPNIQGTPFNYCFAPNATLGTWSNAAGGLGTTLPAGTYNSQQPLSNLVGCDLNGNWCITITDNLGSDNGFIFGWDINLNPALVPPALTFTPTVVSQQWQTNPTVVSSNGNTATVIGATSGTQSYTFQMTDDFGCTYDTTISIYVLPSTDPNCILPCVMDSITAIMTNCYNTPSLQYDMTGNIYFTDPPLTGTLVVQNCFGQQQVFNAPFVSPITYSFNGLQQDGQLCSMTATFSAAPTCNIATDIQSPPPITFFSTNCIVGSGNVNGTIEFINLNNLGGPLVVSISDGTTTIDTIINPPFTSPQIWSVSGLNPAINPYVISYYFSGFQSCGDQTTINCGCSADAGTSTVMQTGYGINSYILCDTDQVIIDSNNDYSYPDSVGPIGGYAYQPALAYLVYTCPPTPGVFPGNDPCFFTIVNSLNNITQTNNGTSVYSLYGGSTTFPNQTLYYTPITLYHYDPILGNYILNSNCWDIGDVTEVTFLSPIISTITPNCLDSTVAIVISGGYAELFGGNFTASNLLPANASFANTVITNGGTITINGLQNGDMYSFDVVDDNGCPHTISGGPFVGLPNPNAGIDDLICSLSYSLNPISSFGTGSWSGNGTFSPSPNDPNAIVTVASPGTYTFTWTEDNGNGCINSDDVSVVFSNISHSSNVVQTTCGNADGEITLMASNGITPYQYSIDGGLTFQNSGLFTGLIAATYNIIVIDAVGCQDSSIIIITDQGGPVINSVNPSNVLCVNACDGSISINATGASLFSIDNGLTFQIGNTFLNLCSGTYDIVVQDNLGCFAVSQTIINSPPVLDFTFTSIDLLCNGICSGEINVSGFGGTPSYQYSIDNGTSFSPTNIFSNLCANSYDIIISDSNGCISPSQNIIITEPTLLTMTLGVTNETCAGLCDGQINSIPVGGTGPGTYTYSWVPAAPNVPLNSNLCSGIYSLTVTDNNGCTVLADTLITGPSAVVINNIVTTDEICNGDCMGTITINANGATLFSIDGVNYQASNVFNNLCAGSYTAYAQDINTCVATDTCSIYSPSPITILAFADTTICIGGTAQLSVVGSGGTSPYSYTWDNGFLTQNISVSPNSLQTFCIFVLDSNGCSSSQECITVTVNPPLNVVAYSDTTICNGDSANLLAIASGGDGGPYIYTWDNGLGIGQSNIVGPPATTIYTVSVSDACETPDANDNVTITVEAVPVIGFLADTLEGCAPLTVTFNDINVPNGSTCHWDFGDGGTSNICSPVTYSFQTPGCWDVSLDIITANYCSTSFTQSNYICIYDYPNASFTFGPQPANILNPNLNFINQSTGASSYLWSFNIGGIVSTSNLENPSFFFPDNTAGSYQVCLDAINDHGCLSSVCETINIDDLFLVYVPNAFSPGGADLINNEFIPVVTGADVLEYEFYIFNRWGEMIFESHNENKGWDGRYKGLMSQQDAYVWKLMLVDKNTRKPHEYTGHVILLK